MDALTPVIRRLDLNRGVADGRGRLHCQHARKKVWLGRKGLARSACRRHGPVREHGRALSRKLHDRRPPGTPAPAAEAIRELQRLLSLPPPAW